MLPLNHNMCAKYPYRQAFVSRSLGWNVLPWYEATPGVIVAVGLLTDAHGVMC